MAPDTTEEVRLAETGPLLNCVLGPGIPEGYAVKEVEERYNKYWYIDLAGPPTVVTSKTQSWQDPVESVTRQIAKAIEDLGLKATVKTVEPT